MDSTAAAGQPGGGSSSSRMQAVDTAPAASPTQQQQDAGADDACHICMSQPYGRPTAAVKGCGHAFCHACILQWVGSRTQPVCPVCRGDVIVLVLADGTEEAAKPAAAPPPEEAEADLSCLDHSYFLTEVARLLSRAHSVHDGLFRDAFGSGRRGGSRHTQQSLEGAQDVLAALQSYKDGLTEEVRFDPQVLLGELYRLDRQLASLQAGEPRHASAGGDGSSDPWQRTLLSADDHDDEHNQCSSDDHHYDDEEHHLRRGLSHTPGRRPSQRHVSAKPARSGSGSGGGGGGGTQQQAAAGAARQQQLQQRGGPGR